MTARQTKRALARADISPPPALFALEGGDQGPRQQAPRGTGADDIEAEIEGPGFQVKESFIIQRAMQIGKRYLKLVAFASEAIKVEGDFRAPI